ncbi:putative Ligninase LG5 [Glarea lozoyensis 74030]|uniref:Peroxidase n=1 Tax=Glarea lozoyensis (strain ATCC 74030 / MF5533) TaxID=1104152 RepID=H0EN19_GLAL7|nr:putative Ligninase LG5 [Glarea lozoyensis 74030]
MLLSNAVILLAVGSVQATSFTEYISDTYDHLKPRVAETYESISTRAAGTYNTINTKLFARKDSCPPVWTSIAAELKTMYWDPATKQCNDDARAAIREAFHDCGAWQKSNGLVGGCDGSLILSVGNDELLRGENNADLIQFSGNIAVVTCPGGPQIKTYIGRRDSSVPAPPGLLPDVHAPAADLYKLFQDKGFDAKELAALLGAHSTSKTFHVPEIPVGAQQDTTPGLWDVKYYQDTLTPPQGVFVLPSDKALAAHPEVGKEFKGFVGGQGKWTGDFAKA